jgi:hypothetical protein
MIINIFRTNISCFTRKTKSIHFNYMSVIQAKCTAIHLAGY